MTFLILFTATAITMILMNFNSSLDFLPNFKPFNCPSCLSSWIALIMLLTFEPTAWFTFPATYLITSIYLRYETIH